MKIWTVKHEWSGKHLPIVNSWKPQYGGFDYRVSSTNSEGVVVVAKCEAAERWLPHIRAGVTEYCEEMREEGELFQGIEISLTRIYEHEIDTSELVMFFRGRSFLTHITHYDCHSQLELTEMQTD